MTTKTADSDATPHGVTPFTREGSTQLDQAAKKADEVARNLRTKFRYKRARSSAVERTVHIGEVTGSIPVAPTTQLYVYMMDMGGVAYKIGVARDPDARLREVQTGSPFHLRLTGTVPVKADWAHWLEKALHHRYGRYRMAGEWFCYDGRQAREVVADFKGSAANFILCFECGADPELARIESV